MGLRMLEFPIRIFSIVRLLGRWPGLMISILRVGSCGQIRFGSWRDEIAVLLPRTRTNRRLTATGLGNDDMVGACQKRG